MEEFCNLLLLECMVMFSYSLMGPLKGPFHTLLVQGKFFFKIFRKKNPCESDEKKSTPVKRRIKKKIRKNKKQNKTIKRKKQKQNKKLYTDKTPPPPVNLMVRSLD